MYKRQISAQTNGTYYKAFALSFTDPWLGGRKPNSFTVSAHFSEENNAYYVWQKSSKYFRSYGLAAGLGKRLSWPDPYFTLYAEASYERYTLKDWDYFVMRNGSANLLSLKLVFGRNSVDQPIYPRRGSDFSVSVQLTPPYSLWDGKDYSDQTMSDSERFKWIEFHKWQLKAQWFAPLTRNANLVLMARAEMGYLGSYNRHKVSPFERFEVGGDGMTGYNIYGIDVISMRGYDDGALDPVGENYAVAYNKYTLELRYPVILKPSSQIYVPVSYTHLRPSVPRRLPPRMGCRPPRAAGRTEASPTAWKASGSETTYRDISSIVSNIYLSNQNASPVRRTLRAHGRTPPP